MKHNDRLIFGTNSIYLVKIPDQAENTDSELPSELDWEFAQKELLSNIEKTKKIEFEHLEKMRELQGNIQKICMFYVFFFSKYFLFAIYSFHTDLIFFVVA